MLKIARIDGGYRVRVEGRGSAQESPALAAFVTQYLEACDRALVVVDLSACEHLDSTFLGCLVTLHQRCQESEGASFLTWADDDRRGKLLSPTRIDRVLEFAASAPETKGDDVCLGPRRLNEMEFGRHIMESHRALAGMPCAHAKLFQEIADQLDRELNGPRDLGQESAGAQDTV